MLEFFMKREVAKHIYDQGFEFAYLIFQKVDELTESNHRLTEANQQLEIRIKKLENQLAKDSHNSSKPSSSDGLKKTNQKNLRKASNKNSGGQKGHKGSHLKKVANPKHIKLHKVNVCGHCGGDNLEVASIGEKDKRQVFDLPPLKIEVTEHQVETCRCQNCGKKTKVTFPEGVNQPTQYGKNIKAYLTYLNSYQYIPLHRLSNMAKELWGQEISEGTIFNITKRFSNNLGDFYERIKETILKLPVVGADETGIHREGKTSWLHYVGGKKFSFYAIHDKRGKIAMEDIGILNRYKGTAVHDCYKSYFTFDFEHALCNAHLLRELIFEFEENQQKWAKRMISVLLAIKRRVDDDGGSPLDAKPMLWYKNRYRKIIEEGLSYNPLPPKVRGKRGRIRKGSTINLLERLRDRETQILLFAVKKEVPFDNNESERSLRMAKLKQKISGCFRSKVGSEAFSRIHTYLSTVRKQDKNLFQAIKNALQGQPMELDLN